MLPCPALVSRYVQTVTLFDGAQPLTLTSGETLSPVTGAYETYGQRNRDESNTVFICPRGPGTHIRRYTRRMTSRPGGPRPLNRGRPARVAPPRSHGQLPPATRSCSTCRVT